jgi:hypothetical protein
MPYISIEDYEIVRDYLGWKTICDCEMATSLHKQEKILDLIRKISTARCARLSIRPFGDGDGSIEKELARYEKLVVSRPVHASPAEHIATPDSIFRYVA